MNQRIFFLFIFGLILLTSYTLVFSSNCVGEGCEGYDPNTMGCTVDSSSEKEISGGVIQARRSTVCDAKWARTVNRSGVDRYAAASIWYGCADYCYNRSVSSPYLIEHQQTVYTAMTTPRNKPVKTCGRVEVYGPIQIPVWKNNSSWCDTVN